MQIRRRLYMLLVGINSKVHEYFVKNDNSVDVMAEDWDTLIILDAARADHFDELIQTESSEQEYHPDRTVLSSYKNHLLVANYMTQYTSAEIHTPT